MKVILKQDIPNLGEAGEIKDVADGYARNYLIPKKLVIPYTTSSRKALEHQKRVIEIKKLKRKKMVQELAKSYESLGTLEVQVRVGAKNKLFGSVTNAMIAKIIEEKTGKPIDKRKIQLNEPIKQLGEFKIKLHLSEEVQIPLIIKVVPHPDSKIEETEENNKKEETNQNQSLRTENIENQEEK
ncbi:MAG: 50S ribosomal protein L9 [Leptospiraceae bacterium]|nr:MAG: 50S ribosomal protein L9 [Leptospiraceae bacterium]